MMEKRTRLYNGELIIQKLTELGFSSEDIPHIVHDVSSIVELRVIREMFKGSPEHIQKEFESLDPDQVNAFYKKHKDALQKISLEEIEKIEDETWREYFEVIGG